VTDPEPLLTVQLVPPPLDRDEITITAHVGDVELAAITVHPAVVPAGRGEQLPDLIAALLRDTLRARGVS
jgi:hypothetical protein